MIYPKLLEGNVLYHNCMRSPQAWIFGPKRTAGNAGRQQGVEGLGFKGLL